MNYVIRKITAKAPLLPIVLALSAGIIIGRFESNFWIPAITTVLAISAVVLRQYYVAAIITAIAIGTIDMSSRMPPEDITPYTSAEKFYRAKILSTADNDNSQSAIVELYESGNTTTHLIPIKRTKVQITIPSFEKELYIGYDVVFKAIFEPIESRTDLPDERDASDFLRHRLVAARTLIPPEQIYCVEPTAGFKARAIRLRTRLTDELYRTPLDSGTKEFINATLLGDSKDLSQDTRQAFRDSGLSHVLALSGLHVGVIAMLISLVLWPLKVFGHRYIVMSVTILILWLYVAITGFSPSVTRAAVMMTLYLVGRMLQRRTSALNSLMAAALIILIVSPEELFGVGFQLSFTAVLTIILFADLLNPVNRKKRLLYALSSYVSLSISAMLGTAIVSAFYFHSMPLYFIISNVATAILLPLILGGGILILLLTSFGCQAVFICLPTDHIYNLISSIATHISEIPYATINGIYMSGWVIAIYAIALIILYAWLKTKRKILGLTFAALLALTFFAITIQTPTKRPPHLYIAREKHRTDIIIDNNSSVLYIVTTKPSETNSVTDRVQRRYSDFMGKRSIDSIKIVPDNFSAPAFSYRCNIIKFGRKSIVLANEYIPDASSPVEYLLICRGYRGAVSELITRFRPDTILLSSDLHIKRSGHYENECLETQTPYIDLHQSKWNLTYEP